MTDYPIGTYATIKVENGVAKAWPVVERVGGGWQSGAHHYPDAVVASVRPLTSPLMSVPESVDGDETNLRVATAQLDDAEHALDSLRQLSDGLPMDDYCEEIADALETFGAVLVELQRRRIQMDALAAGAIQTSHRCPECGHEWGEIGGSKRAKITLNIEQPPWIAR